MATRRVVRSSSTRTGRQQITYKTPTGRTTVSVPVRIKTTVVKTTIKR